MHSVVRNARRIVVKVGSSLVTNEGRGLDRRAIADWAGRSPRCAGSGKEVVVVSSGAIAEGMKRLGWTKRPQAVNELQAAAAVGQMGLVQMYESMLLASTACTPRRCCSPTRTWPTARRYLNARSTLRTLLALRVVPIINENDTVVIDEIRFGDNDTLGALVANLIEADCAGHPHRPARPLYRRSAQAPGRHAGDATAAPATPRTRSAWRAARAASIGSGGMLTKILAAKRAARSGAHTVIAWGREPDVLLRLAAGEAIGTPAGRAPRRRSRRASSGWPTTCSCAARVVLDAGAVRALRDGGKSLLPIGVTGSRRIRARRGGGGGRYRGARGRARPGQLQRQRGAPHRRQAEQRRSRPRSATWTSRS